MNIVEDLEEWKQCLDEPGLINCPRDFRQLFSFMLISRGPHNATTFWNDWKESMTKDYISHGYDTITAEDKCLYEIQKILINCNYELENFSLETTTDLFDYFDETTYLDNKMEVIKMNDDVARLNVRQKEIYDDVMRAIIDDHCEERLFYIGGPSGTGKTFLCNVIIRQLKIMDVNVRPVAWTGVAASLLISGRTCHSAFKLPFGAMDEHTTCRGVEGMEDIECVVWDEIAMAKKYALEAVEKKFRELSRNSKPFGNRVILVCGDFRTTLPIQGNSSRTEIVQASLKRSALWPSFKKYSLDENMRIDSDQSAFAEWLLEISNGKNIALPNFYGDEIKVENSVKLPSEEIISDNLIKEIFPTYKGVDYSDRVILTLSNEEAVEISNQVLEQVGGDIATYESYNQISGIPDDSMNSYDPSDMPPHNLNLKVGAIVMLVRHMNPAKGLCNGARLRVDKMMKNTLILTQLNGPYAGEKVLLPRVSVRSYNRNRSNWTRWQFPIRLSFAMNINKSQGLTFEHVGIYLPRRLFAPGQLYSSCCRVRKSKNLKILLPKVYDNDVIENFVYPEVFD